MRDMTLGKPGVPITGASSGRGKTSVSDLSGRAARSTARRVERMSDIEAAVAWIK
jgi:NADP-dependent 3-hydroxy acid dehydrogenase YdfG